MSAIPVSRSAHTFTAQLSTHVLDLLVTMQHRIDYLEEERGNFISALHDRDQVIADLLGRKKEH